MKSLQIVVGFACVALIAGCKPEKKDSQSDGAVKNGSCSAATIDLLNAIRMGVSDFQRHQTQESLTAALESCETLKESLGERSCKALDNLEGVESDITFVSHAAEICERAESLRTQPAPEVEAPAAEDSETMPLSEVGSRLRLKVADPEKAEALAEGNRSNRQTLAIEGNLVSGTEALDAVLSGAVGCAIYAERALPENPREAGVAVTEINEELHSTLIAFDGDALVCLKKGEGPTLKEAKAALKDIFELTALTP